MKELRSSANKHDAAPQPAYVELCSADFQKQVDGKPVSLYTIKNKKGMVVKIHHLGTRVE
jgi:hypothetical protein